MPSSGNYRTMLDNYFKMNAMTPKVLAESNNNELLTRLSFEGMGATFSIEPHAYMLSEETSAEGYGKIFAFPISGLPYEVVIAYPDGLELSKTAINFLEIVKEVQM